MRHFKYSCRFYADAPPDGNTLTMTVNWTPVPGEKERLRYYTGIRINRNNWKTVDITDPYGRKIKIDHLDPVDPSAIEVNAALETLRKKVDRYFSLAQEEDILDRTSKEGLKKFLADGTESKRPLKLLEGFRTILDDKCQQMLEGRGLTPGSYQKWRTLFGHVNGYVQFLGKRDLSLRQINRQWLEDFHMYLLRHDAKGTTYTYVSRNLKGIEYTTTASKEPFINSTAYKGAKTMKAFLREAKRRKWIEEGDWEAFKVSQDDTNLPALTLEHFTKIAGARMPNEHLEATKDIFMFMMFTSLRYGDVKGLRPEHVQNGEIRKVMAKRYGTQGKTRREIIVIPLNPLTETILHKYREYAENAGYCLPVPANQVLNRNLKKVGLIAGLTEMVIVERFRGDEQISDPRPLYAYMTCHMARRSFVTVAHALQWRIDQIIKVTGHRSEKELRSHYLKIGNSEIRELMEKMYRAMKSGV